MRKFTATCMCVCVSAQPSKQNLRLCVSVCVCVCVCVRCEHTLACEYKHMHAHCPHPWTCASMSSSPTCKWVHKNKFILVEFTLECGPGCHYSQFTFTHALFRLHRIQRKLLQDGMHEHTHATCFHHYRGEMSLFVSQLCWLVQNRKNTHNRYGQTRTCSSSANWERHGALWTMFLSNTVLQYKSTDLSSISTFLRKGFRLSISAILMLGIALPSSFPLVPKAAKTKSATPVLVASQQWADHFCQSPVRLLQHPVCQFSSLLLENSTMNSS